MKGVVSGALKESLTRHAHKSPAGQGASRFLWQSICKCAGHERKKTKQNKTKDHTATCRSAGAAAKTDGAGPGCAGQLMWKDGAQEAARSRSMPAALAPEAFGQPLPDGMAAFPFFFPLLFSLIFLSDSACSLFIHALLMVVLELFSL